MKQVTQKLRDGQIEVLEVPEPVVAPEGVLVDVRASLLSAGTERSTVKAARASLVGKARARPDQARQVLSKARSEGLKATLEAVRTRLEQPSPLGYSSAGIVLEVGERVADLRPGDRVACAGGGYAIHAELNHVPGNLCVPIPAEVAFESAAFTTVASIAMHGVRQAAPQIGERVAVVGLGLVGQLACRLLLAAGCEVAGIDLDEDLVARTRLSGVEAFERRQVDPASPPAGLRDCDAVLITAATSSADPVQLAGAIARDRGRVVIVGDVGMDIPRSSYYGKELDLRLSRSYGPGRYDRNYEERGLDYPVGYVRWTERRNMGAFVALLAAGRVSVEDLITARIPIEEAPTAYDQLLSATPSPLGIMLTYGPAPLRLPVVSPPRPASAPTTGTRRAGVIGAGSFAQRLLIPGVRDAGFELAAVASGTGLSARGAVDKFGFECAVTPDELLAAADVEVVFVASRHGSHAEYATRALHAGKPVFVEKPPALTVASLAELKAACEGRVLQVGFNRRHAPLARAMREHIVRAGQPIELLFRVAAGRLPADHWLNDPADGGGRLLGEGCHFVDFACWFCGQLPSRVVASVPSTDDQVISAQQFVIALTFSDGSIATVVYGSEAADDIPKEYVEAHAGGRSARLDDFQSLELRGDGRRRTMRGRGRDKGHRAQFTAFRRVLDGAEAPSSPNPLDTMAATLRALMSAGVHLERSES